MFWGSKWRTYFGLYYASTFAVAQAALEQYSFPVAKNRGWAIEDMETRDVIFSYQEYKIREQSTDPNGSELQDSESTLELGEPEVGLGVLFIHREKSRLLQPRPKRMG